MRLDHRFTEGAFELGARANKASKNDAGGRDEKLERLCGERADRFVGVRVFSVAQLVLLARIWFRLLSTPLIRLRLEDNPEAQPIRRWLDRRTFGLRSHFHQAASVLRIDRRADPLAGSRFSTLRRMERKAAKVGVTCAVVPEHERAALLQDAVAFEQNHPDVRYRREQPNTADLVETQLWLAAYSAAGLPLVLAVTPVSGNAALMRYLRTLASTHEATLARYAITAELIRRLAEMRVRYLVDNVSPLSVSTPLRHFATMVGFRIVRAELQTSTSAFQAALSLTKRSLQIGSAV